MNCPRCQAENRETDGYCRKCGQGLLPETQAAPRYRDRASANRREIAVVVLGALVLLVASFVAWYALNRRLLPEETVREFAKADLAGDTAKEAALVSGPWDPQQFLGVMRAVRTELGGSPFRTWHIVRTTTTGTDSVTVVAEVTVAIRQNARPGAPVMQAPVSVTFDLERKREGWLINSPSLASSLVSNMISMGHTGLAQQAAGIPGYNVSGLYLPAIAPIRAPTPAPATPAPSAGPRTRPGVPVPAHP